MTITGPANELINDALPVVSVALWLAIYVVYFWRDPEIRRWLERQVFQLTHRRQAPSPLFPRPPPARLLTTASPAARTVAAVRATVSAAPAPVRLTHWQAARLPMRYRLLGQVRPASNDN